MLLLPNNFIALIISELRHLWLITCTTFPDSTSQSSLTEVLSKYNRWANCTLAIDTNNTVQPAPKLVTV